MDDIKLKETKYGFKVQANPPAPAELAAYYSEKYYQQGLGSYSTTYTEDEIRWWRLRAQLISMTIEELKPGDMRFLDVGCGEGWTLDALHSRGHTVKGIDFSKAGVERWHSHLCAFFEQGDVYALLEQETQKEEQYDIIFLGNVIEHVLDPESVLVSIKKILKADGLLILVVPNDFSDTQQAVLAQNPGMKPWWVFYEHISYFNLGNMKRFLTHLGFGVRKVFADYPIEFDLFTEKLNYVSDKSSGKDAHKKRMHTDIFLFDTSPEALRTIYATLGSIGVGRNLLYYCALA